MSERGRLGGVCAIAALAGACAYLPAGATTQAERLHADWSIFFYAGIAVAGIVIALILLPLIVWRRREGDPALPRQFHENPTLEIACTVVPLLIVAYLFYVSYANENAVEALAPAPGVTVDVTAFDWSWRFKYEGSDVDVAGTPQQPPELVLPVDETTRIVLRSADVDHAFWVPDFLFKRDAIPGIENRFDLHPVRMGVYRGECAEFCGLDHAAMTFRVRVIDDASFERWLKAGGR